MRAGLACRLGRFAPKRRWRLLTPHPLKKHQEVQIIKTKRLNFRITEEADAVIRKKAAEAGMTITDYVIAAATGKEVINFDWLNGLITQIKRLGNNLNQLVILARQGRISTVHLDGAQQELSEVHELLADVFSKGR